MTQEKFSAVMGLLVPQVVYLIAEKNQQSETEASAAFYRSQLYALLEEEETKMWHLSPMMLYHLFQEEASTGTFQLPEEA